MTQEDPKNRPGQKSGGGEEDAYDSDASEPEVPKRDTTGKEPDQKPSQAEGERDKADQ